MLKYCSCFLLLGWISISESQAQEGVEFKRLDRALERPEEVVILKLRRDRLTEWPTELSSFPNLRSLDLSHNKLRTLPEDLSAFRQLEELNLTGNKLDSLQSSIGDLTRLRKLLVGNNEIFHVTERIGELKDLEYFELWSNNIYYLPNSISELTALKELDLRAIQMGEHYQTEIKDLMPSTTKLRISPSCNCD